MTGPPCGFDVTPTCPVWATGTADQQAAALAWAERIIWALSGRQFGTCPVVCRPCYQPYQARTYRTYGVWMNHYGGGDNQGWFPFIEDGAWRNCGCRGMCCCGVQCEVWLPGPVATVTEILIDGVPLANGWRVDNGIWLVRQDGGCWPACADLTSPAGGAGTFQVSYTRGRPLPLDGAQAVADLACERLTQILGQPCSLSPQVTSISRDGVSVDVVPAGADKEHPTGVASVDLWLRATNPRGLIAGPTAYSPDLVPPRVTTFTPP